MSDECGCGDGCGCEDHAHETGHGDLEQHRQEPPDPQLDPTKSPGYGHGYDSLADIDVGRDVTIGEMDPSDLTAADTEPVSESETRMLLATLVDGARKDRQRAALELANREAEEHVLSALATVARTDDDADVRQFAIESLAKLGGKPAVAAATVLASEDPDPWVRAEAVVALDRLDDPAVREDLVAALDDEHHAVRRNALIAVFKRDGEATLDVLLDAVEDPSERVREFGAHMLAGVDDDAARDALVRLLEDDDESEIVRLTAERALGADPARFRRQFSGPTDEGEVVLPGEDLLNRVPEL